MQAYRNKVLNLQPPMPEVADKHGVVAFFDDATTDGVEDSVRLNVLSGGLGGFGSSPSFL